MSNSYAQAVLRTADLAEVLRVADQLIDLADTRQLEVDFEAVVHRADELERLAKVMPDANWWPRGPGRSGSSRDGDSAFECLPVVLSRWTMPPEAVEGFLAAVGDVPAMVRWDFSGWPEAPEIGLGYGGTRGAYLTVCLNARDLYLEDPAMDHTVYVHVKQAEAHRAPWLAAQVGLQVMGELEMAPL
ncbi:hypothetical protein [Streptomyces sp. NBC_00690]|uniref:hypothetical protein n=1 Tax=Streptomyces sp. NBC_00690 TaxID=2975808 RepID=UPI002E2A9055|nr:hypothetical protein [Streptomyces sp. NBC_00690]